MEPQQHQHSQRLSKLKYLFPKSPSTGVANSNSKTKQSMKEIGSWHRELRLSMAMERCFSLEPQVEKARRSTKVIGLMISKKVLAGTPLQVVQYTPGSGKLERCTAREKL